MMTEREILWRLRGKNHLIAMFSFLKFHMSAEDNVLVTEDFEPLRAYHLIEETDMTIQGICKSLRLLRKYEVLKIEYHYGKRYYVLNYKGE